MSKPKPGDVLPKHVFSNNGTPVVPRVSVAVLGLHPGDTVEITYGADEIVIRRAGETAKVPRVDDSPARVRIPIEPDQPKIFRCWLDNGTQSMSSLARRNKRRADKPAGDAAWEAFNEGYTVHVALTEAQAIAWCLDGVLPTDGGEG